MICPNCDKDSEFTHHGAYSGDGWNEPRIWEDWLICNACGDSTDQRELDRVNNVPIKDEPHASDCAYWCSEPCDCMMRFDPDDLLDRYKDREMEEK